MAEQDENKLRESVGKIPQLIATVEKMSKQLRDYFMGEQKFTDIKVGEKTYKYSGEKLEVGTEVFDGEAPLADGDYLTETHKFTVKEGKITEYKEKEKPAPVAADFSTQIKTVTDAYEVKLAAQKTDFEKQIKQVKEAFSQKVDELVNGTLSKIGDLIKAIETLPTDKSQFNKKDGEPGNIVTGDKWSKLMEDAKKTITQKVFTN